ncbi:helix-turn-helix transcriptional regulator [Latilactobacillus sakei]|uniref:helix-turn-helix transcriptional regulator n=1 Tax=Latilactobacillus sakei TaxID=1599 RepID=UPI00207306D1|nr:helix-turn-helix transcriptional regulator [Latilactobacillus sakei]USG01584.1 hypothetical protein A4W86_00325 [Latilactobacillus sakei]
MLATTLKKRRIDLHLTQQAVADQLHTSRQTISNWENGKNYLNKVANDYQLINQQKKTHLLDYALLLTLSGLVIIILATIFFKSLVNEQLTGLLVLVFTTILVILSYFKTVQFYSKQPGNKQPLLIPKVVGIGLTINPNHPIGKIIWLFILIFVVGSLLTVIF